VDVFNEFWHLVCMEPEVTQEVGAKKPTVEGFNEHEEPLLAIR